MRRQDREVTDFNRVLEILQACDCCRIGFKETEGTYIVPLNFGFEVNAQGLVLYFHGAKNGKKAEFIGKQQIVGFELDTRHELVTGKSPCEYSFLYQSIIGKGIIHFIENEEEKINGMKAIMKHYSGCDHWEFHEQILNMTAVMKLSVTEWSCKEHRPSVL